MNRYFLSAASIVFIVALAAPAYAVDDCPPGGVKHAALTGLDHASMEAAVRASFVGLYHREPTGVPGSGPDDLGFWISTFDHYGAYGDAVCRAGWNAYAELRLSGASSGDPTLGDQPARFLPTVAPPIVVPPSPGSSPPLPPLPSVITCPDTSVQLAALVAKLDALQQNVTDGRAENQHFFAAVANNWKAIVKWATTIGLSGIIGAKVAGH